MSKDISEILLEEIRINRKDIGKLDDKLAKLDKDVFSNKIKLSLFIAGVSIFFNIILIVVAEKLKTIFI